MDGKSTLLASLLVAILVGGGLLTLTINSDEKEETEEEKEDQITTETEVDFFPQMLISSKSKNWDGENITINGFVVDESAETSSVSIEILKPNLLTVFTLSNIPVSSDGSWSTEVPFSVPGQWFVKSSVTDSSGQKSNNSITEISIIAPEEKAVVITFMWDEPNENTSIGNLSGFLIHPFPETCSVEYRPKYQSPTLDVIGILENSTGTFSMDIDTDVVNGNGTIFATCGLFSVNSSMIEVILPVPPEPAGDLDLDGIMDDEDQCDSTPSGEPVYETGCSDSETDDDLDSVMNTDDQCPNTPQGETVDFTGCSLSQKDSDNDGISDADDTCPNTPIDETPDSSGCSDSQKDSDGDGVSDALDQCPNTPQGDVVSANGCTVPDWAPEDSWQCQNGQGPWVKDLNGDGNSYQSNTNGANSAGGGGSGPWFQCEVSVNLANGEMVVNSNGIPNHDFLSTMGCCANEVNLEWHIPLNPVNDTGGGHDTSNCPASAGRWECAPARGAVAVSVNGVPIYGVEEGPGGDAIALHFDYFVEDRQPIFLGHCASHSANVNFHYHYDSQCSVWTPGVGETIADYDWTDLDATQHSPIIGWAFDGYPIYGMYGNDGNGGIKAITSSYEVERTQENGDQGYNGIDDWNYVAGVGDLDECNGRWGVTPEYPQGTYHYVSTPLSGSSKLVTDTDGNQVPMIGMPYFLLCYHGVADLSAQPSNGQGGGGGGGGGGGPGGGGGGGGPRNAQAMVLYEHMPELLVETENLDIDSREMLLNSSFVWIVIIALILLRKRSK